LLKRLDNGMACMLMGFDGINVVAEQSPDSNLDLDLMGAELSAIVNQVRQAAFVSQFGQSREFVLRSETTTILLKVLTDDYFIVLVMKPDAHVGKGRFLLRMAEKEIVSQL
jgi:predicted regulator of Ras-like GTPase activity (Roadblock/LC7/MglB family)